jgi:hypothetical protein
MSKDINTLIEMLSLKDDTARFSAFQELLKITEEKVDWFEEYGIALTQKLTDDNSYQRSIGLMLLCNLAKNDKKQKFNGILKKMMLLVNDDKFITQRQYLQNIWKVAIVDNEYRDQIVKQLREEFENCTTKKHYNLLRLDIISSMIEILNTQDSESIRSIIGEMINEETDEKSRKKYIKMLEEKR